MSYYQKIFDFIEKHYPRNSEGVIPLHEPLLNGNEKKYLIDCIDTTYISSVGRYVEQFEELLKNITGSRYAIAMVNGTCALHIAFILSDVKPETEVITQPLTFIATCNAISHAGAIPVFVDVDKKTMGMCPKSLETFMQLHTENKEGVLYNKKSGRKISACVPVHVLGHACQIEEIKRICENYNIPLIEDAAEGIGAYYKDQHLGTFGQFGMLSFNGNKTITCGGGGALITNDENLAQQARHLSTTARISKGFEFVHDQIGYNYRMTNVNAAIGCAQLERLPDFLHVKRSMAYNYANLLSDIDDVDFMVEPENAKSNYWFNTLMMKNRSARDDFLDKASDYNIQSRPVWALMPDMPMYKNCESMDISSARFLYDRLVSVPSSASANI